MAINVPEEIKTKPSLISIGAISLKMRILSNIWDIRFVNNDENPSHFLTFRISFAFQKWTELKHILIVY